MRRFHKVLKLMKKSKIVITVGGHLVEVAERFVVAQKAEEAAGREA